MLAMKTNRPLLSLLILLVAAWPSAVADVTDVVILIVVLIWS